MEKLKAYILPNIANISIGLGGFGIFIHLLTVFSRGTEWFWAVNRFIPVYFQDYIMVSLAKPKDFGFSLSPVTLLFFVMLIAGGFLYKKTAGQDARLLRFGFSVIFIEKFLVLPQLFLSYELNHRFHEQHPEIEVKFLDAMPYFWSFLIALPFLFFSYHIARWLTDLQKMDITYETTEHGTKALDFAPVSKGKRFWHLVFDFILMVFIVAPFIFSLVQYVTGNNRYYTALDLPSNPNLVLWIIASLTLYYLLFEGFFQATPAKHLTGSQVLESWTLEKPTFWQILWRTLARRIPFDAFSFFGKKGWHDSLTNTVVVQEDSQGASRAYHKWWPIAFLSLYILPFGFRFINQSMIDHKKEQFLKEAYQKNNEILLATLSSGDVILVRPEKTYEGHPNVLLIEKISEDSLYCLFCNLPESKEYYHYTKDSLYRIINSASKIEFLDEVAFSKQSLQDNWLNKGKRDFYLEDSKFNLENIYSFQHPEIRRGGASYDHDGSSFSGRFTFAHDLFPIQIVHAKMMEGKINFLNTFPFESTFYEKENKGIFTMEIENLAEGDSYKAALTLRYRGADFQYILEGVGTEMVIYRELE